MKTEFTSDIRIAIVDWKNIPQYGHFTEARSNLEKLRLFVETSEIKFHEKASTKAKINQLRVHLTLNQTTHIIFPWLHDIMGDFDQIDELASELQVTFGGLAAVTHLVLPGYGMSSRSSRKNAFEVYKKMSGSRKGQYIFTWDINVVTKFTDSHLFHWLPDTQDINVLVPPIEIRNYFGTNPRTIGFFGQLFLQRGLIYLHELAFNNPTVNFLAIGRLPQYRRRQVFKFLLFKELLRRLEKMPNVEILDVYLAESGYINWCINNVSGVILDTRRYPGPSGIAARARNFGKTVVVSSRESALLDLYGEDNAFIVSRKKIDWERVENSIGRKVAAATPEDFALVVVNSFRKEV